MNIRHTALALMCTLALGACGSGESAPEGGIGSTLAATIADEVRDGMAGENFSIGGDNGLPRAELTPQGDLLIDGVAVPMDDAQRALALAYREDVIAVAAAGARIGLQGAGVAKDAALGAVASVFSGDGAEAEEKIKASTDRIKQAAAELCDTLPALLEKQQALAAAVPAFAPYADISVSDIQECRAEVQ